MKKSFERLRSSFWTFIVLYLIFSFTHGIQGSYTASVLTTLEKTFNLPSSLSGLLGTIATVGYFISAPLISFYFGRKHRVRLFAICMLSTGLCGLIYTIPHFLYMSNEEAFSVVVNSSQMDIQRSADSLVCSNSNHNLTVRCEDEKVAMELEKHPNYVALSLFCLSEICHGLVGASIWTVGLAFIDDNSPTKLASKILGVMFLVRYTSPVLAFGLGSLFLSIHNDLKPSHLTPENPKWIGAWWLGYFVCFTVNSIICIPTFFLPEKFNKVDGNGKDDDVDDVLSTDRQGGSIDPDETSLKELFRRCLRILKIPVFTLSSIAVCFDCYHYAFLIFLPKYMEVHFMQTSWMASLLGGMLPYLAGGITSYFGGVISGRFNSGSDQGVSKNALFSWLMSIVDAILMASVMFIPCSQSYFPHGYDHTSSMVQLNQFCNLECSCPGNLFDPVCGSDNVWYVSPCHAGCSDGHYMNNSYVFDNCSCIESGAKAETGICYPFCFVFIVAYASLIILLSAISSSYNVPITNVVLKCVQEADKSLALGVQTVLICIAIFPSTMIYGRLLDSTCILWSSSPCDDSRGSCLAYDHYKFRMILHGVTLALRILSSAFYGWCYHVAANAKKTKWPQEKIVMKDKPSEAEKLESNANNIN